MFFEISHTPRSGWSHVWHLGPLMVGTDSGWKRKVLDQCVFLWKGYAESQPLETLLWQIHGRDLPDLLGNFCVLIWDSKLQRLAIKSDLYRGFPIYLHNQLRVGNLEVSDRVAWADTLITVEPDLTINEHKFDVIGDVSNQGRDLDWIHHRLRNRIQSFLKHNTLDLRIFLSGGVDTLLIYSYLLDAGAKFEVVSGLHFDFDAFWLHNNDKIIQNWGYNQLHHWAEPCVLASGAPGDEFMMRNPAVGNLYLLNHETNVLTELERAPESMHREHFLKDKNKNTYEQQQAGLTHWDLCNITVNDWQHWHLGHTLTWTPLRDLEIFKAILHLDYPAVLGQILNSDLSQTLMDRNVPGLSSCLSAQKNHGNVLCNLKPILLETK